MPSASYCSAQICSPKAVFSSHPTVSAFSSSAHPFSILQARRGTRGKNGVVRCASNTESSPRLPAPIDPGDAPSSPAAEPVRHETSSGEKNRTQFLFVEDERFTPLRRRPRFQLRSKTARGRRPLWSRIFFASKKVRSIILLNVLTVIYASDIPVLKEVEAIINPASFNMVRFVVSAIPFLPFIIQERGDGDTRYAGVELGFWVSCGYLSQAFGLLTSEAGRASFISAFTVVIVPLVDGIFGARVPAFIWFGATVSLIGVALLECGGSPPCIVNYLTIFISVLCTFGMLVCYKIWIRHRIFQVGDVLNIFSAVFFGIHMLRTEQISRTTKKEKIMALLGYEVCTVALSTIIWFVLRDVIGNVHNWNIESCTWSKVWDWMSTFPWIPALYTGVFSTGLCLWAEMNAMNNVSATETAIVYGLEPVWGAAFAWFLLGERWGNTEWIGATLVLCGSLAVQILSSMSEGSKDEFVNNNIHFNASREKSDFSFSTVLVDQRKNLSDIVKKPEKL